MSMTKYVNIIISAARQFNSECVVTIFTWYSTSVWDTMVIRSIRKHQSFLESFRPLHMISRFIGVNQFYLPQNYHESGQIILKRSNVLFLLIQFILYIALIIVQSIMETSLPLYLETSKAISGMAVLQFSYVDYKNRKRIGFIISELHGIDCMVTHFQLPKQAVNR